MAELKGRCQHGEFTLIKGCPQCMAERRMVKAGENLGKGDAVVLNEEREAFKVKTEPVVETALALKPGADVEVMSYHIEALKLLEYAELRVIATVEDNKVANDDLNIISKLKKVMEEKKQGKLAPLKAQMEAIRDTFNFLMAPILEADKITREKMLGFNQKQAWKRREQEEINRKRQEAAEAEMRLNGELSEPVNLVEVQEAPKKVSTDLGTTGMVDHWTYEVFDFAALSNEYKVADSAMLNSIAKRHHDKKEIPGVRFYNEPYIAARPR